MNQVLKEKLTFTRSMAAGRNSRERKLYDQMLEKSGRLENDLTVGGKGALEEGEGQARVRL